MENYKMKPMRGGFRPDKVLVWRNAAAEPIRLIDFVMSPPPGSGPSFSPSRTDVKTWLRYGHLKVDGVISSQFDTPVAPGQWVELNVTRPFVVFRHHRLQLVYEDDDVIVVNKSYGLLSVATKSRFKEETAFSIVREYLKRQNPENKLYVVHRLDRDTSGLMMFAKNEEAQETLRHNWNNMVLARTYVAVVEGYVADNEGYVKSYLAENKEYVVYSTDNPEEGRLAVTNYKVLRRGNGYSLMEFSLDTGRKNQIRVHCKDMGHSIAGDRKYGAKSSPLHRLALHARTLRFAHPVTRKDMSFETPVPSKFLNAVHARQSMS